MATPKKTQIVITANAAVAKKVMDELQQRIDQIKAKMKGLDVTTKEGQKEFKKLEKELVSYNSAVSQNITNTERIKKAMDNLSKTSLNELKRALSAAKSELGKMSASDPKLKQMQGNVKALQQQIDKLTGSVKNNGGAWNTAVKNLTAYVGLFAVFNKVKETVTGAIKKNFDYSASLTDIRKVSGLAEKDIADLSNQLAKIDTRTTVEGLAQLAYQGSKLGMGKYGVEGLTQFVKAADQINVAIGEELGEEALPALSKLVETMGLIPKMGIEHAMLATGSAMFKLSTSSTATSANIVEVAKRLTAMSRVAGITTDQLLALGSASDSMMLMPEVTATAFNKLISSMQSNASGIEKALAIEPGTINNLFSAGHAMDALVLIFEQMKAKGNMSALNGVFKELGSDGARLTNVMVTMAKNVDMLKDHLYESEEAFEDATAVTDEYNMQMESAKGILERANNLWEKAFVNPEGVDNVKALAQGWYDISQTILESPLYKGTLNAALQTVILSCKLLVALLPLIINFLVSAGIYKGISMLWEMGKAIKAAAVAQQSLNMAVKGNPYVAAASVLMTLVGVVWSYVNATNEAKKAEEEAAKKANAWKDRLGEAQRETDTLTRKLHSYKVALDNVNLSQEQRNQQIARFNKDFRQYINKLGIEIKSVDDLRKHYSALSQEVQRATYYRLREQAKEDAMPAFQKDRLNANNVLKGVIKGNSGYGGFTSKGVMEMFAKGANANWIYQQMIKGSVGGRWSSATDFQFDPKTGGYSFNSGSGKRVSSTGDVKLLSALRYYQNATARERNKEKEINDYFGDFVPENYHPWVDDEPGTLSNNSGGGSVTGSKNTRTGRHNNTGNTDKQFEKIAKDRANALLANIEAYYEEQARKFYEWVGEMNENGEKVSEGYIKEFMHKLEEHRLNAVGLARQSIATAGAEWDNFKSQLTEDQFQTVTETDTRLLKAIEASNVKELHDLFAKLGANLSKENNKTLSENLGALLDEIFKNGAKNLREAAENLVKRQQEIQKILNEHDYTGTVDRATRSKFDELRFLQPAKGVNEDTEEGQQKMSKAFDALTKKARESVVELYKIDPASKDFQKKFIDYLSVANDGFDFSMYKEEKHLEELKAFYVELIKYTDEYTEAEKRATDRRRKIIDREWSVEDRNVSTQQTIKEVGWRNDLRGKQPTLSEAFGFYDIADDPEIKLYEYRKTAARDYYDFVKARTNDAILIREAEQKVLEATIEQVKKEWSSIQERVNAINGFMQPTYDAIEEMGNVWAKFRESAESGQQAMLDNLRNFIKQYAVMMIKGLRDQAERKVKGAILVKNTAEKNGMDVDELREASKQKKFRKKKVKAEDMTFDGKQNEDGSLDQEAFKNSKGMGYVNAVGEEQQQNPLNPVEAAEQVHALEIDELRSFHEQMLKEEALYREMMQKLQENPEAREQIISEYQDRIEQERKLNQEQSAIRKQGFDALKKVGVAGWNALLKQEGDAQQQKTDLATTAEEGITDTEKKNQDERAQQSAQASAQSIDQMVNETIGKVVLGIAGGSAKTVGELGWWGIPLVGVISAALMGLLNYALSFIGKGSSSNAKAAPNTKLVSGMLTYDNGNIQDLKPFMGEDGNIYYATEDNTAHRGVNLLTKPTATTINGAPALVAENGPELVIGRETTAAMMQNNPALLKALYAYDKHHSGRNAYDAGNVSQMAMVSTPSPSTGEGQGRGSVTDVALLTAVNALLARLNEPISAKIDMYGRGNLYDSMTKANAFMKGK